MCGSGPVCTSTTTVTRGSTMTVTPVDRFFRRRGGLPGPTGPCSPENPCASAGTATVSGPTARDPTPTPVYVSSVLGAGSEDRDEECEKWDWWGKGPYQVFGPVPYRVGLRETTWRRSLWMFPECRCLISFSLQFFVSSVLSFFTCTTPCVFFFPLFLPPPYVPSDPLLPRWRRRTTVVGVEGFEEWGSRDQCPRRPGTRRSLQGSRGGTVRPQGVSRETGEVWCPRGTHRRRGGCGRSLHGSFRGGGARCV